MKPTSIRKKTAGRLSITWEDGHESDYTLERLRDICPCAGCSGETVLFQSYQPPPPDRSVPGRYDLKAVNTVGSYAVQMEWGDGHSTGIYTWEHLLRNCPCPAHAGKEPAK